MKVIVEGIAIEYRDEGSGPTLLLLHGWKASIHTFDALAEVLKDSFRVVRLDLPGFGESEMPPVPWGNLEYARFVASFIQKRNLSVNVLAVHSMGGRIAMRGIAEGILQPEKLILIASAGVNRMEKMKRTFFFVLAKTGRFITSVPFLRSTGETLREKLYNKIGSNYADAGALRDTYLKTVREDVTPFAQKISIPTLLIWGSEDKTTPLENGKRLGKLIHGSRLKIILGAGHAVPREKPEEVAALIKDFAL